jgi:hypothetical protein
MDIQTAQQWIIALCGMVFATAALGCVAVSIALRQADEYRKSAEYWRSRERWREGAESAVKMCAHLHAENTKLREELARRTK